MYHCHYLRNIEKNNHSDAITVTNVSPRYAVKAKVNTYFGGNNDVDIEEYSDIFDNQYSTNDVYMIEIKNATIGPRPIGIPRYWPMLFDGGYIRDFINPMAMTKLQQQGVLEMNDSFTEMYISKSPVGCQHFKGKSIWLHAFSNIDHFYRESIPLFQALSEMDVCLSDYNIVLSGDLSGEKLDSVIEIIKLYGVQQECIFFAKNQWLHFEFLLTMNFASYGHLHTPGKFYLSSGDYIREVLLTRNRFHVTYPKIFISRKNAVNRCILNEYELSAFLSEKGYFICDPGDYSMSEQIVLFSNAKIIIGVHGMGMANSIFSKELSFLMEIMSTDWNRVSYFRVAQLKKADYACYWLKPLRNGKMEIDIKAFSAFYSSIENLNQKY